MAQGCCPQYCRCLCPEVAGLGDCCRLLSGLAGMACTATLCCQAGQGLAAQAEKLAKS